MAHDTLTLTLVRSGGQEYVELAPLSVELRSPQVQPVSRALGLGSLTIGTSPECDLVAQDASVSRIHARILRTADGLVVEDLGSKNGTRVAGVPVLRAPLDVGVPVALGASVVRVHHPGGEPERLPLHPRAHFGRATGSSFAMRSLFSRLDRAAQTREPILLTGESGTGKEVLARAVHDASPQAQGPFVVFDCGGVSASIIESELFGHARGAFTGADQERRGLLEEAKGGTVFLDEIGELPLDLQPRLLRVLAEGEFRPVGAAKARRADVRIVAATHADLRAKVASGTFREDLYYRLQVVEIRVPPLRERKEDIPLLVEAFLASLAAPRALAELPPQTLALLQAHHWPGNVRELRNAVLRLMLFPAEVESALDPRSHALGRTVPVNLSLPLREAREAAVAAFERSYLEGKLREHGGSVSLASEAMGVSRQLVHRLLVRHGLRGQDD